jgi:hypothetical protein
MESKELRIGNLVNYKIVDKLDERKEWFELCEIDAVDLQVIDSEYQPIPLTEEWLLKLGFKLVFAGQGDGFIYECGQLCNAMSIYSRNRNVFLYSTFNSCEINIQYVHQLQNLHFALTNEELTLTK